MLYRIAENALSQWLAKKRRKPLVLRGARQVGKSTLVRNFAAKQGLKLHEVNLERHMYLDEAFKTLDLHVIIPEIEALAGANIQQPDALLFLDEIQAAPHAIQALRYFHEERKNLPVIAAGSLLEFTLSEHQFSMPVGRIEYFHLGPMTFKEFLLAVSPELAPRLSDYSTEKDVPMAAHRQLLKKQREYLLIGGMPEAVLVYKETGSIADVADVHRSIAETYQDDFAKYARNKSLALMQRVFKFIPRAVGKKIKYSNISREHTSLDLKTAIDLLANARICHKAFHSHCSGIPLHADINENVYKLIFMDVGIANHICGVDWITIQSYPDSALVNEGAMAEQFIGQHLIQLKPEPPRLCYWLREGKSANAEVDYVISSGPLIAPVEVKAGKSGSLKSLQQFVLKKNVDFAVRFDLNTPSLQDVQHVAAAADGNRTAAFKLLSLPLYMVEELPRLIDQIRVEYALR